MGRFVALNKGTFMNSIIVLEKGKFMNIENYVFPAAVCRGIYESGDTGKYFGSTFSLDAHIHKAVILGWVKRDGTLTKIGEKIGKECSKLPEGRAYLYAEKYEGVVTKILKDA